MTELPARRVLVVDDDRLVQELLVSVLLEAGFAVERAADGAQALEACERFEPEIVLLDVMLPGENGHEICRRLKARGGPLFLPILLITARDDLASKLAGFSAGADDYLVKPFAPAEVLARIGVMLRLRDAQATILRLQSRKEEFLNIVNHDLRMPVATIIGYCRFMLESPNGISPEQADILRRMTGTAKFMEGMIAYFLGRERTDWGELELYPTRVRMDLLLRENVRRSSVVAEAKRIVLGCEAAAGCPVVYADENKLQQVLNNLVSNAIRHSPQGGRITLACAPEGDGLLVRVEDEGPGIAGELRDEIFNGDLQVKPAEARGETSVGGEGERPAVEGSGTSGTGLGLAICRRILELHGGRIWVEPGVSGKGARFCFTVPPQPRGGRDR
ncbi:MAG: response regulator [Candidatus Wallbacteria bacterium]|nr:response regulator [Candidatus Wallbacteria bacterium]